jgi:hypothetical protein
MRLVENAKYAWRWFSVQALALLAVLPLVWEAVPAEAQGAIPDALRLWIITGVAIAGLAGRLIKQKEPVE